MDFRKWDIPITSTPADAFAVLQECVTKVGTTFHELVIYHPADRYWLFHGLETAIFVRPRARRHQFLVGTLPPDMTERTRRTRQLP